MAQISCLNEDAAHTVRDLLKGGGDKWLASDADEQLLLHIPVSTMSLCSECVADHLLMHR